MFDQNLLQFVQKLLQPWRKAVVRPGVSVFGWQVVSVVSRYLRHAAKQSDLLIKGQPDPSVASPVVKS